LTGVAVNVTLLPVHIGLAGLPAILTLAVILDDTVILIVLDVAVEGEAHEEFEVITTLIISPVINDDDE
jgi:hypothetical protein